MINVDETVILQEVSTRDGLQNEQRLLSVAQRIEVVNAIADAGLRRIQIGAFVNPRVVPQMAGSDLVLQGLEPKKTGVLYTVLILNEKGLEKAVSLKVEHVEIYVSASETHSLKNSRIGVREALVNANKMIRRATQAGIGVTGGIMCAFGCFFEGPISQDKICEMVADFVGAGATEIGLADTTGMAKPKDVRTLVERLRTNTPVEMIGLHLHDTYGYGLRNLGAGIESGVRKFDSSLAGIGGCPFIPGAKGNIATDQAVNLIEQLGFRTCIELERLRIAESILRGYLSSGVAINHSPGRSK